MKINKVLIILGVLAIALSLSCKAFAVNLEVTTSQSDTNMHEGIVDQSGTPLPIFAGYWVQIIKVNGVVHPPDSSGNPTGGDTLVTTVEIGENFIFGPDGNFDTEIYPNPGDIIICRAFNSTDPATATYYGNSGTYTVTSVSPQTWNINGSIDAPAFSTSIVFSSNPPSPPTNFMVSQEVSGDLIASWTASVSLDAAGTHVIWRTDRFATAESDYLGSNYSDIPVSAAQSLRVTNLTSGTLYYFTGFAYDTSNNFSTAVSSSETAKDSLPPSVVTAEPVSGNQSVDPSTSVSVTFNDKMSAPDTVNSFHMTAQNGSSVPGTGTLSPLNTLVYTPNTSLVGNVTYLCTVDMTAKDKAGNAMLSSYTWSFKTAGGVITGTPPTISNIKFDGYGAKPGDFVAPRPRITADIADPTGVTTIEIDLAAVHYIYSFAQLSAIYSAGFMDFIPSAAMATGANTVSIIATNVNGDSTEETIPDLQVAGGELRIIGQFINYPSEVDSGKGTTFAYTLSAPADIQLYIYGIGGILVKKSIPSGTPGGMSGYNEVFWDGLSGFGHPLGNGMYVVIIASGNTRLGKMNLIINNTP